MAKMASDFFLHGGHGLTFFRSSYGKSIQIIFKYKKNDGMKNLVIF